MIVTQPEIVFVSDADEANGAEKVLLLAARTGSLPIVFLKKSKVRRLIIPALHKVRYVSNISMLFGFIGLPWALRHYRKSPVMFSTHPYVNVYLGLLKRIGFLKSKLVFRECTSVFLRYAGFKKWLYKVGYRYGYVSADLIICQTHHMRQSLIDHAAYLKQEKITVIENPLDIDQILAKANAFLLEPELSTGYICTAGRHISEKGFNYLLEAFKLVHERFPNIKLLIIGDGPKKKELICLIEQLRLRDSVILKNWQPNVIPYFKHAKVCVVSSVKEGFPNVLLEMMTVNRQVVSTLCAGGIENIPGLITVPVSSPVLMAEKIISVLEKDSYPLPNVFFDFLSTRTSAAYTRQILQTLEFVS
jgi:glycosyltransferase involved in cell wall biosynthesis